MNMYKQKKEKIEMEMKIEIKRIEGWEVIGGSISVYHQVCEVDFFMGIRDGQQLTLTYNLANFAASPSFEAAPDCKAAYHSYYALLSRWDLNCPVPKMGHALKTKNGFDSGRFFFFKFLTYDTV